jgi:uncharacterized membrane protein YkoI
MSNRIVLLALSGLGILAAGSIIGCAQHPMDSDDRCEHCEKHRLEAEESEKEDKVAIDKIPAPVVEMVKKETPDGVITDAEKEQKHGKMVYEMDVKSGNVIYEMKVSEDGQFISKKIDDEKDEDEKK